MDFVSWCIKKLGTNQILGNIIVHSYFKNNSTFNNSYNYTVFVIYSKQCL